VIRVRDLSMTYRSAGGEHQAVRGVSFEIGQGQFYTLLGPSGCGKTTTLRCVAGLERPDSGQIAIGDEVVFDGATGAWVAPNNRNIGMVFQSYAIWPHMSVFDNVAFPLRYQKPKPGRAEIRDKVLTALALVQLGGLEDRPAPFLSGGQQQRLALARALVAEPRVLLLDEPLSKLDAKLREEMRGELRDLVKRLNVTTLFVTHEQIEALTMSDTIAVMKDGEIVQEGNPSEIYGEPGGTFVADFIGKTNLLRARVVAREDGGGAGTLVRVETPIGILTCRVAEDALEGDNVVITVRPENVMLSAAENAAGDNAVTGEVEQLVYLGNMFDCLVRIGAERIRVQIHPSHALAQGDRVTLLFPAEHCVAMRE
jgi:iron(III) transport system ATP-binding protein